MCGVLLDKLRQKRCYSYTIISVQEKYVVVFKTILNKIKNSFAYYFMFNWLWPRIAIIIHIHDCTIWYFPIATHIEVI